MGINIGTILGGNLGQLVKDVVGTFKLSPEKKAELQAAVDANAHEIQLKEYELATTVENHLAAEVSARADIIKSEMQQGDNFTKRARPTIVYCGLAFIFLNHVLPAILTYCGAPKPPVIDLPPGFWTAWEVVVGVWSVGRSAEKMGAGGGLISAITGNKNRL